MHCQGRREPSRESGLLGSGPLKLSFLLSLPCSALLSPPLSICITNYPGMWQLKITITIIISQGSCGSGIQGGFAGWFRLGVSYKVSVKISCPPRAGAGPSTSQMASCSKCRTISFFYCKCVTWSFWWLRHPLQRQPSPINTLPATQLDKDPGHTTHEFPFFSDPAFPFWNFNSCA